MTKNIQQAEDVAAVLQGKVKCPACGGMGIILRWGVDRTAGKIEDGCWGCQGRRWMTEEERRGILSSYDNNEMDYRDSGMEEWERDHG